MNDNPRDFDVRVWWIPQTPMEAFLVSVDTVGDGMELCDILADYDAFQFRHSVKPDYSNAGGVQMFRDGEWNDCEEDDEQPNTNSD